MIEEIWKDAFNFEGYYSVSNYGRIRREKDGHHTSQGKILKPEVHRYGHLQVKLYTENIRKRVYIHKIVWETFIGQIEPEYEINHIDGIKTNNKLENLEKITHDKNIQHALNLGLLDGSRGENSPNSKLTQEIITIIRKRYKYEKISQKELAKEYGVNQSTITRIINYLRWNHSVQKIN